LNKGLSEIEILRAQIIELENQLKLDFVTDHFKCIEAEIRLNKRITELEHELKRAQDKPEP